MKNQAFHALQIYILSCGKYLYDVSFEILSLFEQNCKFQIKI